MEFFEKLLKLIQENQVLLTALGIGGAGSIIYWLRNIPVGLYNLIKREFTTELTVTNQHLIFFEILKLIEKKYQDKNLRKWKLSNGKWGDGKVILSMGYGSHLLLYDKKFILVTLTKESANQTNLDKDTITFLKLGRDHRVFDKIIDDAKKLESENTTRNIYKLISDYWSYIKVQKDRLMDSIFVEQWKKDLLISTFDNFFKKEEWYLSHGIPYQLGILLYGPPGTGKTSLIKAIATYLNYSIYYLPVSKLDYIEGAIASLPEKCIMVIEDIDTNFTVKKREETLKPAKMKGESSFDEAIESYKQINLSEILNAMDGLFSVHGRILIATTNYLEKLDAALIRPGRIDLKLEIGYVNKEILVQFLSSFFPENMVELNEIELKDKLTISELQNMILEGKSDIDIVEYCKV